MEFIKMTKKLIERNSSVYNTIIGFTACSQAYCFCFTEDPSASRRLRRVTIKFNELDYR